MSGDGTYAPQSPDLSSFDLPGPTPPAEPPDPRQLLTLSQQSQSNFSHLQPPASAYFPSSHQQTHAPHHGQHHHLAAPPQALAQPQPTHNANTSRTPSFDLGGGYSATAHHNYFPPRLPPQPVPGYAAPAPPQQQQPSFYQPPAYGTSFQYPYQQHQQHHQFPAPTSDPIASQAQVRQHYSYPGEGQQHRLQGGPPFSPNTMPPRRAAAAAAAAQMSASALEPSPEPEINAAAAAAVAAAPVAAPPAGVEAGYVKTKFPTARIKRIMQADEEVGKVAQQTPIAVGKALELFMVALVTRSADVARQRNSKRVSAAMLKQVVESDDQWDFLRDIVGKVEVGEEKEKKGSVSAAGGAGAGGGGAGGVRAKVESESEEEGAAAAPPAKRKRGGGRKKKVKGE